jgi:hypothetical protein
MKASEASNPKIARQVHRSFGDRRITLHDVTGANVL